MKKTMVAMLLLGGTTTVMAQDSLKTMDESTGEYNAYSTTTIVAPPPAVLYSFEQDYPMIENAAWYQTSDYYRTTQLKDNRNIHMYYGNNGNGFTVALPVLNSYVAEDVVAKALNMYSNNIYSISQVRGLNDQEVYQVTVIENGVSRTEWIGADGSVVMDVHRAADADELINTSEYAGKDEKVKIKVENSDGAETKIKTKDGKTVVKEDD